MALTLSRVVRSAVHAAMTRSGHLDRTTLSFLQQMIGALIWVRASVASVVIDLAAQSTLGNLVAGVSITIYRPFRLGDTSSWCRTAWLRARSPSI